MRKLTASLVVLVLALPFHLDITLFAQSGSCADCQPARSGHGWDVAAGDLDVCFKDNDKHTWTYDERQGVLSGMGYWTDKAAAQGRNIALHEVLAGSNGDPQDPSDARTKQAAAFKRGGLEAAAAVTGSYSHRAEDRWEGDPLTLKELADVSAMIVIGTPHRATCHLTRDGRSIETAFVVDLETIVKGEGGFSSVTVFTPGGKIGFADGSTAEVKTPGFLRPQMQHRAVWFLKQRAGEGYTLSRGRLGVYDLDLDASRRAFVVAAGGFDTPLGRHVIDDRLSPAQFVEAVWTAVR